MKRSTGQGRVSQGGCQDGVRSGPSLAPPLMRGGVGRGLMGLSWSPASWKFTSLGANCTSVGSKEVQEHSPKQVAAGRSIPQRKKLADLPGDRETSRTGGPEEAQKGQEKQLPTAASAN